MGGINIFRLQERKVRATACTQSPNLALAIIAVFSTAIGNTLDNPSNKTNVLISTSHTNEENK